MPSSPRKRDDVRAARASAFTLVEILVAMSLTALIVAISGRVALQMSETRKTAHHMNAVLEKRNALDVTISEDFARLLPIQLIDKPPPVVVEGSILVLELPVLATLPVAEESLHTPLQPCLIRYWKHREDDARYGIERQIIDLTNPARVFAKERVANGIEEFHMAVRRKGEWSEMATVSLLDAKEIEAVQVRARWVGNPVVWQRIFRIEHVK